MMDLRVIVDEFMPDVYPDTRPDGSPHPEAGNPVVMEINKVIYISPKTAKLLDRAIDNINLLGVGKL